MNSKKAKFIAFLTISLQARYLPYQIEFVSRKKTESC